MLIAVAAVAGCNANTQVKTAVKNDRQAALDRCIRSIDLAGPGEKSELKILTGASDARLSAVVCDRIFRGVEAGRIRRGDPDRIGRGQGTEVFKVLKGR